MRRLTVILGEIWAIYASVKMHINAEDSKVKQRIVPMPDNGFREDADRRRRITRPLNGHLEYGRRTASRRNSPPS